MSTRWLLSTIGKRGYIADYIRQAQPDAYIIGTGRTVFTPGFRRCDESVIVPDIGDSGYLAAVQDLVSDLRVDAILSLADPDVDRLSSIRATLSEQGVACFFPSHEVATMGFDKYETYRWAIRNDIRTPATFLDPAQAVRELGLPLIRKPRFGSASAGFEIIHDEAQLVESDLGTEMIYQQYLEGEEINLEFCGDLDGRPMGLSCWHKLDSRKGETELAVTTRREDMLSYGLELATAAAIPGPCDVDVFDVDGEKYLIEFNMRFGGGYPVSHLAGADFPGLMVQVAQGLEPEFAMPFESDVFMMKELQPFAGKITDAKAEFLTSRSYRTDE